MIPFWRRLQNIRGVRRVVIALKKEAPGHIANRLAAALWREAVHLMKEGVADVRDIDNALVHGPGLRWQQLGPALPIIWAAGMVVFQPI